MVNERREGGERGRGVREGREVGRGRDSIEKHKQTKTNE